jgi:hypothetical protein
MERRKKGRKEGRKEERKKGRKKTLIHTPADSVARSSIKLPY